MSAVVLLPLVPASIGRNSRPIDSICEVFHKKNAADGTLWIEKGSVLALPFRYRVVNVKETKSFQPRMTTATIPLTLMVFPFFTLWIEEYHCLAARPSNTNTLAVGGLLP
jgi:hypothetical protein